MLEAVFQNTEDLRHVFRKQIFPLFHIQGFSIKLTNMRCCPYFLPRYNQSDPGQQEPSLPPPSWPAGQEPKHSDSRLNWNSNYLPVGTMSYSGKLVYYSWLTIRGCDYEVVWTGPFCQGKDPVLGPDEEVYWVATECWVGYDSVVGIVTHYRLDGPGIKSR
jgi:hypothetical protein